MCEERNNYDTKFMLLEISTTTNRVSQERETETERQAERQRHRERDRQRQSHRDTNTETERDVVERIWASRAHRYHLELNIDGYNKVDSETFCTVCTILYSMTSAVQDLKVWGRVRWGGREHYGEPVKTSSKEKRRQDKKNIYIKIVEAEAEEERALRDSEGIFGHFSLSGSFYGRY